MLRRRKQEISRENEENSVFTDIFLTEIFLSRRNKEISVFRRLNIPPCGTNAWFFPKDLGKVQKSVQKYVFKKRPPTSGIQKRTK